MSQPFDLVLFGAAGDLASRKLIPAMYRAYLEQKLPDATRIVCCCRDEGDVSAYQDRVADALKEYLTDAEYDAEQVKAFQQFVLPIKLDIADSNVGWETLAEWLQKEQDRIRVYYLAIPPALFGVCCQHLDQQQLINDNCRLVVEKPLGYNAESADAINNEIAAHFKESSVYRIDHYLGKETVQNLMALRFTNVIFEHLWDAKSIDHVQISISETVGLEGRAGFYNEAGALRDMVQNHLLQLLCLVAMESPHRMQAHNIRAEKVKVLEALRPITEADVQEHTVRGQYVAGNHDGKLVPGYLEELGDGSSNTETFVAIRAYIDNWRWARVPFYLRTGKRMKRRCAEIVIQYKDVSHRVYGPEAGNLTPNRLVIRLQPEESIQLSMMSKDLNTLDMSLQPTDLNLNFSDRFKHFKSDAYKRLILDAVDGNSSLFIHRQEVAHAWAWIDPIIEAWQASDESPHLYRAGSWGPPESDELMEKDGFAWFNAGGPNSHD